MALVDPESPARVAGTAATILGGILAAAVASLALLGSLMSDEFLTSLKRHRRHPFHFMAPFVVTAALAVVASIAVLVVEAIPVTAPAPMRAGAAVVAGGATVATMVSLIPDLVVLNRLVALRTRDAGLHSSADERGRDDC